jgi:hypothetical protein
MARVPPESRPSVAPESSNLKPTETSNQTRPLNSLLWKAIPTLLFVASISFQLFGPHPIGKSDNGDFPKVLGRMGVWVAPPFQADLYGFFITDYRIDDAHLWDPKIPSSEFWIAGAAKVICERILPPGRFDIRVLGALHAVLATLAFWLLLIPLQNWAWPRRMFFTLLFLVIFADPQYVQFFSTAYMDAASMVFFMLVFAAAWNAVLNREGSDWRWALLFCLSVILFLSTKLQHQACVIPFAVFCVAMAYRTRDRAARLTWLAAPFAIFGVAWLMFAQTYSGYRVEPFFSAVFMKLVPLSQNPELALLELGRPGSDLAYNHKHAYSSALPLADTTYRNEFFRDVTPAKILAFYFRHPAIAVQVLRADFLSFAADVPISSPGTMRRVDNPIPAFRANGLQVWSKVRRKCALFWPWHIPILYIVVFFGSLAFRNAWPLAVIVCPIGVLSFLIGSLCDGTETSRHILLYQQATDALYIVAFYLIFEICGGQFSRRKTATS